MSTPKPKAAASVSELMSCPFCDNAGNRDPRHTFWMDEHRVVMAVCCGNCGAHGPWVRDRSEDKMMAESLKEWNRRATRLAAPAAPDAWRQAIDDKLVTLGSTASSYATPREAVAALIEWQVSVALDPRVSSAAEALIERGRSESPAASAEAVAPDSAKVICPQCCNQFRAIPCDVQRLMLDAGFEPPFTHPATAAGEQEPAKGACPICGCEEIDGRALWTCRCPASGEQELPALSEEAYEAGWRTAANWMERDDIIADIGSAAYVADRTAALAFLAARRLPARGATSAPSPDR